MPAGVGDGSAGVRGYYDELRQRGNDHDAALRALANRLVGILDGVPPPPPALQRGGCLGPSRRSERRGKPGTFEAMCAFLRLHRDHPANALRTAQLICTDLRWRRVTAALIVDIEQSNILDERTLDQLAEGFLWEDELAVACTRAMDPRQNRALHHLQY